MSRQIVGITETDIAALVVLHLSRQKREGKYRMQVCTDLPYSRLDEFMKFLCDNLGIKVGETTADGSARSKP